MVTFSNWLENNKPKPDEGRGKGIRPHTEEEIKKFRHADLIVLPDTVEGTNCGNCKYASDKSDGMMYCKHPDIEIYVTDRNCCKYWDHPEVKRNWKQE